MFFIIIVTSRSCLDVLISKLHDQKKKNNICSNIEIQNINMTELFFINFEYIIIQALESYHFICIRVVFFGGEGAVSRMKYEKKNQNRTGQDRSTSFE